MRWSCPTCLRRFGQGRANCRIHGLSRTKCENSFVVWVAFVGVVVQLLGLTLAMIGVHGAYQSIVGNDGPPIRVAILGMLRRVTRRAARRTKHALSWPAREIRRRLGRPPPQSVVVNPTGLTVQATTGSPSITVGPAPVPIDAPLDEQVSYLRQRVDDLAANASTERTRWRQAINNTNRKLNERIDDVDQRLGETDRTVHAVRDATVGVDGKALAEAFAGLMLTAVGVALTTAGLPW